MKNRQKNNGFTLIELVVTLSIASLVMFVIYSILISGQRQYDLGQKKVYLNSELSKVSYIISEELKNATLVSTSFGDSKIGILNEQIAMKKEGKASYISDGITITDIEMQFEEKPSGEMINYTVVGKYQGLTSRFNTSVLLNNISKLSSQSKVGILLTSRDNLEPEEKAKLKSALYYSKNYEIPKNYFDTGFDSKQTPEYQFGMQLAREIYVYDGYKNLGYKSNNSHSLFSRYIEKSKELNSKINGECKYLKKDDKRGKNWKELEKNKYYKLIVQNKLGDISIKSNIEKGYNEFAMRKNSETLYSLGQKYRKEKLPNDERN